MFRVTHYLSGWVWILALAACDMDSWTKNTATGPVTSDGAAGSGSNCTPPNGRYEFAYELKKDVQRECAQFPALLSGLEQQFQFKSETLEFELGHSKPVQQCQLDNVSWTRGCVVDVSRTCALQSPLVGIYRVTGQLRIEGVELNGDLQFAVDSLGVQCEDQYDAHGVRTL